MKVRSVILAVQTVFWLFLTNQIFLDSKNLTKLHRKHGNVRWRKEKSSGDGVPKLQISVPCCGRTRPDKALKVPLKGAKQPIKLVWWGGESGELMEVELGE